MNTYNDMKLMTVITITMTIIMIIMIKMRNKESILMVKATQMMHGDGESGCGDSDSGGDR